MRLNYEKCLLEFEKYLAFGQYSADLAAGTAPPTHILEAPPAVRPPQGDCAQRVTLPELNHDSALSAVDIWTEVDLVDSLWDSILTPRLCSLQALLSQAEMLCRTLAVSCLLSTASMTALWLPYLLCALLSPHMSACTCQVFIVSLMACAGTGFMPGPPAQIQGTRASARLAAAGPNPFSAAGMLKICCLRLCKAITATYTTKPQ